MHATVNGDGGSDGNSYNRFQIVVIISVRKIMAVNFMVYGFCIFRMELYNHFQNHISTLDRYCNQTK